MFTNEQIKWAEDFFNKCESKLSKVTDELDFDYPVTVLEDGSYGYDSCKSPQPFHWMSGFWGGMMWLLYLQTGAKKYKNRAIKCSERMQQIFGNKEHYYCLDSHDLGFVVGMTNIPHYKLLNDEDAKIRAHHAAIMLAGRYNPIGEYIVAWSRPNASVQGNTNGVAIIDCLLNLPLLYWASEETGDARFKAIAKKHVDMAVRDFIKPDGSVYHIVNKDSRTGEVVGHPKGQGYADGSSWSRGQSWGVYGFLMSYIHIGDETLLEASKKVANYVIDNFGERKLAPVDYMQPDEPAYIDASANAITACGMIELAKYCDGAESKKYLDFAFRLLEAVYEDCDFGNKNQALVQSAAQMYADAHLCRPFIYADYFLLEALIKIIGKTDYFMW